MRTRICVQRHSNICVRMGGGDRVDDEGWVWPPGVHSATKQLVAQVLWTLKLDGPVEHASGRATALLLDRLERRGVASPRRVRWTQVLQDLASQKWGHAIVREVNQRRTYRIELSTDVLPECPFTLPTMGPQAAMMAAQIANLTSQLAEQILADREAAGMDTRVDRLRLDQANRQLRQVMAEARITDMDVDDGREVLQAHEILRSLIGNDPGSYMS